MREKVFDALEHSFVAEHGAASKTKEVLALARVELATDVVNEVLEDLDVKRQHVNRGGRSLRVSIFVRGDSQAIFVDVTEHLFYILKSHLPHLYRTHIAYKLFLLSSKSPSSCSASSHPARLAAF